MVLVVEKVFAFDGDTELGNRHWMVILHRCPHRTWASPSVWNMDGDGYLTSWWRRSD